MKVEALKKVLKEAVREVFQEELKEVLMEAVRSPKPVVSESKPAVSSETKKSMRTNYQQIIGETANAMNKTSYNGGQPLQVSGMTDTTSPNGKLPEGEVNLDQIMGMMK